jgi:CRP/FNR family transcriptional regulator, cyclic AMP receptor protein
VTGSPARVGLGFRKVQRSEIIEVVASTRLFHGLPEHDLEQVADIVEVRSCSAGHHVFLQGDLATEFYIVASGGVRVFIPAAHEQIDAAILRAGDLFGEAAMLDGGPRLASASSIEPTTLLVIPRDAWMSLLEHDATLVRRAFAAVGASARRYVQHIVDFLFLDVEIPDHPTNEADSAL